MCGVFLKLLAGRQKAHGDACRWFMEVLPFPFRTQSSLMLIATPPPAASRCFSTVLLVTLRLLMT